MLYRQTLYKRGNDYLKELRENKSWYNDPNENEYIDDPEFILSYNESTKREYITNVEIYPYKPVFFGHISKVEFNLDTSGNKSLPDWLKLDKSSGVISGRPIKYKSNTTYVIIATPYNKNGKLEPIKSNIQLGIIGIDYEPSNYTLEAYFNCNINLKISDAINIDKYTILPELPDGLNLNESNGDISGRPTETHSQNS